MPESEREKSLAIYLKGGGLPLLIFFAAQCRVVRVQCPLNNQRTACAQCLRSKLMAPYMVAQYVALVPCWRHHLTPKCSFLFLQFLSS